MTDLNKGKVQGIKYQNWSIASDHYIKGTAGTLKYCMACFFSHVCAIKKAYDEGEKLYKAEVTPFLKQKGVLYKKDFLES